ncbi:MAG: hypothetical protein HC921_17575 [Synechococcaceae cyanobacterium SM2_3_1]|nr:hypothetical protein [Synechococcaceae cyanobacterium SM2_3_1]
MASLAQELGILVTDSNGGSVTQSFQLTVIDVEPGTISGSVFLEPTFRTTMVKIENFDPQALYPGL